MDITYGHHEDLIGLGDLTSIFKVTVKLIVQMCVCGGGNLFSLKTILVTFKNMFFKSKHPNLL